MELIELFDGKKANVTEIGGYDDSYYWDYIARFTVEDQHFVMNIAGSYSGYISTYESITIDNEPPKLTGVEYDFNSRDAVEEEKLINVLKKYYELFVSKKAKISYVYAEDDDSRYQTCHVHIDGVKEEEE